MPGSHADYNLLGSLGSRKPCDQPMDSRSAGETCSVWGGKGSVHIYELMTLYDVKLLAIVVIVRMLYGPLLLLYSSGSLRHSAYL